MSAANKALCLRNYPEKWTQAMLDAACKSGKITEAEYQEITGEVYTGEPYIPQVALAEQLAELQLLVVGQAPGTLEEHKQAKIFASKTQLAAYLEAHPMTYTDGKQYSVTAEKQSLLTSALARYQIATAVGEQTALKWNATGEECTVWDYADLAALALAIAAYVEPLVAQQQAAEVAINACATVQQVEAITIAYGI